MPYRLTTWSSSRPCVSSVSFPIAPAKRELPAAGGTNIEPVPPLMESSESALERVPDNAE